MLPAFVLRGIACCVTHFNVPNFIQQSQNSKVKSKKWDASIFSFFIFTF